MNQGVFCWLAAALAVAVTARPAMAWHERGHMAVALIAYRQLDDAQKKKVQDILANHPHKDHLKADKPDDAEMDEWVVMRAAVWPDWIRKDEELSKPFHHYVNLPIVRLDGASEAQKKRIEKNVEAFAKKLADPPDEPSPGQLLKMLPERMREVKGEMTEAKARATALCWVIHLVGDIHQPLHAAALFTKDSPEGDRGGNSSYVLWYGRPTNLHSIWDSVVGWDDFDLPGRTTVYGVVDLMARDFVRRHRVTPDERDVSEARLWAKESRDLAEKEVYSFKGTPLTITFHFDRHHHLSTADVTAPPRGGGEAGRTGRAAAGRPDQGHPALTGVTDRTCYLFTPEGAS